MVLDFFKRLFYNEKCYIKKNKLNIHRIGNRWVCPVKYFLAILVIEDHYCPPSEEYLGPKQTNSTLTYNCIQVGFHFTIDFIFCSKSNCL